MTQTQNYLGIKNGVVVCIQQLDQHEFSGAFYHAYDPDPVIFRNEPELLRRLEDFFDSLRFPFSATNTRNFLPHDSDITAYSEEDRIMSDKDVLNHHGEIGTFIIRVQQRQNSSWQGRITWVDEDKTIYFRSAWEMMKLIDEALDTYRPEADQKEVSWED